MESILQRDSLITVLYDRLVRPDCSALVLTGVAGIGKTTLAAQLYAYAENLHSKGAGPFTAEALWLTLDATTTITEMAHTLFEAFGEPVPAFATLTPQRQALALMTLLKNTVRPRLIVLDQFEHLLDWQQSRVLPDRPGISEWLEQLNQQLCPITFLLTSRTFPHWTEGGRAHFVQDFPVRGLDTGEGIAFLQKLHLEETSKTLERVTQHYGGHPYALVQLVSHLQSSGLSVNQYLADKDRNTSKEKEEAVTGDILATIFTQQLTQLQRELLLAFSLYREKVPLEAARLLLSSQLFTTSECTSALDVLLAQHLMMAEENRYQVHAVVADYAVESLFGNYQQARQAFVNEAHGRAAHYYQAQPHLLREFRRQINDVRDIVEAVWHWCQAGLPQRAYTLIQEEALFQDLQNWGWSTALLELYLPLLDFKEWQPLQHGQISNELGEIYHRLGLIDEAQHSFGKGLMLFRAINSNTGRAGEVNVLNNLGQVSRTRKDLQAALIYYEQALHICEETGNVVGQSLTLSDLGTIYADLKQPQQALDYYERALAIPSDTHPSEDAITLSNMARIYEVQGQLEQAHRCYQQALTLFHGTGGRWGEANVLNNLGLHYKKRKCFSEACQCYLQALALFCEMGHSEREAATLKNLGHFWWSWYSGQKRKGEDARLAPRYCLACFFQAQSILEELHGNEQVGIPRSIADALRLELEEVPFRALWAEAQLRASGIVEEMSCVDQKGRR
jgi:tetratricopeptide (TPR) repeat protein